MRICINGLWALLLVIACGMQQVCGKSDPGRTDTVLDEMLNVGREQRPLLAKSKIYVKLECNTEDQFEIAISWSLTQRDCWYEEPRTENTNYKYERFQPNMTNERVVLSSKMIANCPYHLIVLPPVKWGDRDTSENEVSTIQGPSSIASKVVQAPDGDVHPSKSHPLSPTSKPSIIIAEDGIYVLSITIQAVKSDAKFSAPVHVEMIGPHGYISATDWPLLPFYGIMCIAYVVFGIIWLIVSFMQWRDLLRIQFWIGGVILLGMLEKAFFYAQYHSLNNTGVPVQGAELTAEFVSCAKRTLARMLVIIMSLGFGIVKPRLGPMLHRVVGVGALYFVLACVESYLRVMKTKTNDHNELLVASIPLAVLDTGICWWIFTSLVQTTRTLRLRRNMVKLSLYRHFTNTLIFSVIASVVFMLYAMRLRRSETCTPGYHYIWLDTAFWHILFSVLLLVIMILWRPTNNNQRYAFTPLLDNPEDEDDDEEEDQFVADAYGVKMRGTHANGTKTPPTGSRTTTEEDDLRWVEENIPSSLTDPALPILDSDDEIINTKFEVSKMQ